MARCRMCRSFWSPFSPPSFLALGLFPFALFRNSFCSRVSWTPTCAFWPPPSADPPLTTLLNTIIFNGFYSLQVKHDSCPTQCWGKLLVNLTYPFGRRDRPHILYPSAPCRRTPRTAFLFCPCVALMYWTDIGESLRSRGFLVSTNLKEPRVAGSSPCTLTTSLAIPIPSSSTSNGPSN